MGDRTVIEWTEATWNPVTGCTKVSPGCAYCYAERITTRLGGPRFLPGLATVRLHAERLQQPLCWRRPKLIFTCSMSDLFHEDVPTTFLADVFETMRSAHWHVFQVLTKRPERMRQFFEEWGSPPSNVWLGVSVENQRWANARIPVLLEVPARVRFVSCEPLLGPLDLSRWLGPHAVNWVIVGGESGGPSNRRLVEPCTHPGAPSSKACMRCWGTNWVPKTLALGWVRSLREQCQAAGVPFFFKQWGGPRPTSGGRLLDGRTWDAMARNEGMVSIDRVGPWSKDKLDILTDYLKSYATIMNNQKKVRSDGTGGRGWLRAFHYVDAFSGTGKAILRDNDSRESRDIDIDEYLDGSPVRAIKCDPPFDRLWFIERDKKRAQYLEQTVRELGALNRAAVLVGDANDQLRRVVRLLGRQERGFVFLDPYGLDIEWKTVETLAETKKFDVFINFSVMGVIRVLKRSGGPDEKLIQKLGKIMLDINWIYDLYVPSVNLFGEEMAQRGRLAADKVANVYKEQLSRIFTFVSDYAIMSNQGRPIYALVGATHKRSAKKIMDDIIKKYKRKH